MSLAPGQKAKTYGIGKVARGGNTRGGYNTMRAFISIGGVQVGTGHADPNKRVLLADLSIRDILNETPDTCQFKTMGFTPTLGQEIVITLGTPNSLTRHFAGHIISEEQGYLVQKPANSFHAPNGIDYTWIIGYRLAIRKYTNQSAGFIARDLIASFIDPNFTTKNVAPELDAIILDEITFTNTYVQDALTQLVQRIGGYWYIDYFRDLHMFVTPESVAVYPPPTALTPSHPSLANFQVSRDYSQAVTRAFCEGGGGTVPTDLDIGNSIIPVDTLAWYQALGGVVTTGQQRISYTGTQAPGIVGTLVGPGAGPSGPPNVALTSGAAGLSDGAYQWAYTHVTAAGESKPSPVQSAAITVGAVPNPTVAMPGGENGASTGIYQNMFPVGSTVQFCYVWCVDPANSVNLCTATGPVAPSFVVTQHNTMPAGYGKGIELSPLASPDPRVKFVQVYCACSAFGATYRLIDTVTNNTSATYLYSRPFFTDAFTAHAALVGINNTALRQADLSGIATGQATVTSRKIYRTIANGSQLKLLATLADNTTTTYHDSILDGSLGANAPASDTSGLQMPAGTVAAGSVALPVASVAPFTSTGGWVIIGNGQQWVRYTGASGGNLTGIPASGAGSITAPVAYNSTATASPALVGCVGQVYPIKSGDDLNLLVQVDDAAAQAALKAALGGGSYSGIKSAYVQDRRLSYTEALARANAVLKQRNHIDVAISYTCRDPQTVSGKTIHVNLPAPTSVTGDFKIQDVTISKFSGMKNQPPTWTVQASTNRYTFEDLIRQARSDIGA